ncbi:MAG: hypothetical protein DRR06_10440 [Gammaproteobacteria bacterium]|nr:MAG: hypothetical protein DRQ62_11920 [Gammaproteobacteria bacterium]RLA44130.1 MAG: hypothetical protein DRR06_10440 [Gammaproteobacteria bacterium]
MSPGIRPQAGVVLVFVSLLLMLLTVMAGSFSLTMRSNAALVNNIKTQTEFRALADAGITYAKWMLTQPLPATRWRADGRQYQFDFEGHPLTIHIQDEAGKFDLNKIDRAMLLAILSAVVPVEQAELLAQRIVEGRDQDGFDLSEDELTTQVDRGQLYPRRVGRYDSLRDLYRVQGMTPALYRQLSPLLSVVSQRQTVDVGVASEYVLAALPGSDQAWVQQVLDVRSIDRKGAKAVLIPPSMDRYVSVNSEQRGQWLTISVSLQRSNGQMQLKSALVGKNINGVFPIFTNIEQQTDVYPASDQ